jgi:DNA processing protein
MPPDPGSFPRRNSIIAGLSLGVVVVEAAIRSGTFITANNALDENRMVFAVPGDISRVNSIGTNQLIREGARLVTCAQDVLEDLQLELGRILNHQPHLDSPAEQVCAPLPKDLPPVETLVCESLELDPMSVDVLAEAVADLVSLRQAETPDVLQPEITHSVLMGALLNLELRGLIKQEPGKRFRRVR